MKIQIANRIDELHNLLLIIEGEMQKQEDFNSYDQSTIDNLKMELNATKTLLDKSVESKETSDSFNNSLNDLDQRIYKQIKVIPPEQIKIDFEHFHQFNFNFIKGTTMQISFSYSITHNPRNITGKILKIWAVNNVLELNQLLDELTNILAPIDTTEANDKSPIYLVVHNN